MGLVYEHDYMNVWSRDEATVVEEGHYQRRRPFPQ